MVEVLSVRQPAALNERVQGRVHRAAHLQPLSTRSAALLAGCATAATATVTVTVTAAAPLTAAALRDEVLCSSQRLLLLPVHQRQQTASLSAVRIQTAIRAVAAQRQQTNNKRTFKRETVSSCSVNLCTLRVVDELY